MVADSEKDLLNATLVEREQLNSALIRFRVAADSGAPPPYQPGQFVSIGLPPRDPSQVQPGAKLVKRPYSVSSLPKDPTVEFFVRLVDNGALTPSLFALPLGGRLWMDDKFVGRFTLESLAESPLAAERDLLLISTGTGIAPFISMLRAHPPGPGGFGPGGPCRRMAMVNGVRIASDLGFRRELEWLATSSPALRYLAACTREPEGSAWTGLRGRLPEIFKRAEIESLLGFPLDPAHVQIMLCGNPEMIDDLGAFFGERNFKKHLRKDPGQIHFERYW
jgi:ferredoxin/flavodoxin---NADP+ reductase